MTVPEVLNKLREYRVPFMMNDETRNSFLSMNGSVGYFEIQTDRESGNPIGFRIRFSEREYPKIILFNTCTREVWCNLIYSEREIYPYNLSIQYLSDARNLINVMIAKLRKN